MVCFRHLGYDFIFLFPAFAYAVANLSRFGAKIVVFAIMFNWFGLKILNIVAHFGLIFANQEELIWLNFVLGMSTIISLFSMGRTTSLSPDRLQEGS